MAPKYAIGDLDHFTFLDFMDHLQGYLGKQRSKKEAIAIATGVSKFLAFSLLFVTRNTTMTGPCHSFKR